MPVNHSNTPTETEVQEALNDVLEYLRSKFDCLSGEEVLFKATPNLRQQRIDALKDALYGMIELQYWESW